MKWTKAQESAITDRGGSLLVSAAAGSGKTAVLAERAVGLMLDEENPIAADRILIVTFTRAAAEELRGRIGARLAAMQQKQPQNMHLRRQRLLLGRAHFCTIDAFCMQLLKLYFAELSLPPDFDKGDDSLIEQLKAEAMAQTLEKMYENNDFASFTSLYGKARDDLAAEEAVKLVYNHLRSAAFPKKQAQLIKEMWQDKGPVQETCWGKQLLIHGKIMAESALQTAEKALEIARASGIDHYESALMSDISFLRLLIDYINQSRWDDVVVCLRNFTADRLANKKGTECPESILIKELRDNNKDDIKKLRDSVFVCTQQEHLQDLHDAYPMVNAIIDATQLFESILFKKKLEAKVLEYSDLEHLARQLLCDDNGVKTQAAKEISSQFDAIMVDEYQDTNNLQALLYSCFANEQQSNIFMVGDVKQSIYRFRLAEPAIFTEKRDSFAPYETGIHPALINLGHNFRSAENIIDQINYCFIQLMSRRLGGIDYDESQRLVAGRQGKGQAALDIKIIDTKNGKEEAADAFAVANEIEALVNQGFLVREDNVERPCRYGDFCILLCTKKSFAVYAAALEAKGIAAVGADEGGELLSPEISPFLSLLRIIDNPLQDVYLAAVMLSPMYNFSPESLVQMRKREYDRSLYSLLLASENEKEKRLCRDIMYLRTINACADFTQLCDEIMRRTGFFAAVSAMKEGQMRRENLNSFIAFAAKGCAVGGLSGFLRRLETYKAENSARLGFKASSGAVSIMTVHKSKGLEFPVCILANTQHGFNFKGTQKHYVVHSKYGFGLSLRTGSSLYRTLAHRAVALAETAEIVSEEMRILYVALTRAKDKLIVTMALKNPKKFLSQIATAISCGTQSKQEMLKSADCLAKWICAAALCHPCCDNLRSACSCEAIKPESTQSIFSAEIIEKAEEEKVIIEEKPLIQPDLQLVQSIKKGFEAARQIKAQKQVPVKMSVSQLSKAEKQITLSRPSFMFSSGLTAAESGTAMHEVLQFINFKSAASDIDKELDRLQRQKFIDEEILKQLNRDSLSKFLKSDVIKRILSADTVLREYDFLTDTVVDGSTVLVQGIADVVIIKDNSVEIVDYKTDKGKTEAQFISTYSMQLRLYAQAVEKRLQKKVNRFTIYSFDLQREINAE